jgi:hypothetical protein
MAAIAASSRSVIVQPIVQAIRRPGVVQRFQVGDGLVGGAGAVDPEQDLGVLVLVRDLGERLVDDGLVVGGGVRAGRPGAGQQGQGLAGVGDPAPERVVSEGLLERAGRLFLAGVAGDDGGVQVDHDPPVQALPTDRGPREPARTLGQMAPDRPAGLGQRASQPLQDPLVAAVQDAPQGGVRPAPPERARVAGQQTLDLGQVPRSGGDRRRRSDQDDAPAQPVCATPTEHRAQTRSEPHDIAGLARQDDTSVLDQALAIISHFETSVPRDRLLHRKGVLPCCSDEFSTNPSSQVRTLFPRSRPHTP